jgi:predicted house-cleaning NTP pyrophosphatase (Maf/HAM1 superfamily)
MIAHPDHSVNAALLLASASPRRRELINLLGLPVTTTSADIDEVPLPGERAADMAMRLSLEKARAASSFIPHPSSLILISSDTVVSRDGEPLGKPRDAAEARSMLRRLRGRTHQVYTAITLIDLRPASAYHVVPGGDLGEHAAGPGKAPGTSDEGGLSAVQTVTDLAGSDVPLRGYADEEIEAYIASGDPFDKAGAYAIQHAGFHPVENFSGCFANVMGLPLCHVTRSLRQLGVAAPNDVPARCQAHLRYVCPVFEKILTSNE